MIDYSSRWATKTLSQALCRLPAKLCKQLRAALMVYRCVYGRTIWALLQASKPLESFVFFLSRACHTCRCFLQSTSRVPRLQRFAPRIILAAPAKLARAVGRSDCLAHVVTDRLKLCIRAAVSYPASAAIDRTQNERVAAKLESVPTSR